MKLIKYPALIALLLLIVGCGKPTAYWAKELQSSQSANRLHAVYALQKRVKEKDVVVPLLISALTDEDPFVRRDTVRALGKFGPAAREAIAPLTGMLNDKEPGVRKAAVQALKMIDPERTAKAELR